MNEYTHNQNYGAKNKFQIDIYIHGWDDDCEFISILFCPIPMKN